MWSADLLKWIFGQNKEEKWEYYKGFLECICTAILIVKKMQQKIISYLKHSIAVTKSPWKIKGIRTMVSNINPPDEAI